MILLDIAPSCALDVHHCGQTPRMVEARGRVRVDARLFGLPSSQYHVECACCGVATAPVYSKPTAEALWRIRDARPLARIDDLPTLRLQAEQQLARSQVAA